MKIIVHAKPGARVKKIEKIDDTHFIISVQEPPREGRANYAIITMLAEYFNTSLSRISLVSGFASRTKIFEIS